MRFITSGHPFFRTLRFYSLFLLFQTAFVTAAFCWDKPFNNASNWGGTGLFEIPTARVLEDGEMRIGIAQALPYRWYTAGMGIFPGLEFSGRFTQMTSIQTRMKDYGSYKDKAFDLKYQILPESKKFPALAIGIHDFHGTRLFPAEYLVLSRQFFPLDITVGLGRKRLKGSATFPLWDELGFFGGIELAVNEWLHLYAEYNPIKYEKDIGPAGKAIPEGAKAPINAGIRIKALPGIDLGISCQRGDTLGFMVNMQFLLGKPMLPRRPDPPLKYSIDRRPLNKRSLKEMVEKVHEAIHKADFEHVCVYTNGTELTAKFENKKYLSNQKAAGRVLRILLYHSPKDMRRLTVHLRRQRISILRVSVKPEHLEGYLLGKISQDIFNKLLEIEISAGVLDSEHENSARTTEDEGFDYRLGIKPDFGTYLNDPSGVFKYRLGIKPYAITSLWKGASAYARYDIPFYSNIWSSNVPEPNTIRGDSWKYMDRDYSFDRLIFNQAIRFSKRVFGRLSLGYFDNMFAGAGGELLAFIGDGRLAMGIESDWVKKRKPATQFDFMDIESHTVLGNIYYSIPEIDVTLHARYGQFLAGDRGWLFDVSREFDTGVVVGFWYSFTDTDDLTGFNRDYHEKGVFLNLPVRMFLDRDSSAKYYYALSPWTRDVAATVGHWQDLYSLGGDLMPANFKKDIPRLKD